MSDELNRAAPIAAQLDQDNLPPLPRSIADMRTGGLTVEPGYTAEQYRQGQRDAIAADRAHRAAQLDAELPPPNAYEPNGKEPTAYSRSKVEQIVAPYAERIRLLERELAGFHQAVEDAKQAVEVYRAQQPAQSFDTPEFRALFRGLIGHDGEVWPQVIAYIDGRTAAQKGDNDGRA